MSNAWPQHGMTLKRYNELFEDVTLALTPEEFQNGWYFDSDYDGLLVHESWEGHEV
ncbi:hypothetical protein [Pseudomonas phage vB_PseuGesM_254]|uniref:Uncharacterized protein n=1 Tax=Pseudomonas phage vB_PseuGesM_254 TaxID=3092638 RepID=A0AAX4G6B0_9CAUD|nr:hypothetical protein [Pseudomonas phage PseuGes_254]